VIRLTIRKSKHTKQTDISHNLDKTKLNKDKPSKRMFQIN